MIPTKISKISRFLLHVHVYSITIRGSSDNGKASNVSGCGTKISDWFRPLRDSNVMKTDGLRNIAPAPSVGF